MAYQMLWQAVHPILAILPDRNLDSDALYNNVAELVHRLLHLSPEECATVYEALDSRLFVRSSR